MSPSDNMTQRNPLWSKQKIFLPSTWGCGEYSKDSVADTHRHQHQGRKLLNLWHADLCQNRILNPQSQLELIQRAQEIAAKTFQIIENFRFRIKGGVALAKVQQGNPVS